MTFDFSYFPTLETPRLVLREIIMTDAPAIFRIRGDYEVTRYNIGSAYPAIDRAEMLIESMTDLFKAKQELRWGIILKEQPQEVVGMCGYNYWHPLDRRASIGFDLARVYWRRGIMSEALHAIFQFGFEQMQLNRIEADCSAENEGSIATLQKVGFTQEGHQREQYYEDGAFHDLLLWSLLRREYKKA